MALQEYKCPNCGGPISFDAGTQEMVCPYCDTVMDVEALKSMDDYIAQASEQEDAVWDYTGNKWGDDEQQGMVVYSCNSCGGEIVGDESLGAASCPFCGSPVVISSKFSGDLRPDMVIPFKLDKKAAIASLEKHYLKKKLLPKVFKDRNHLNEVKGVYVPFWLYDSDVAAHVEFKATKTSTSKDSNFIYTKTSTYRVIREGGMSFDRVPVDGSKAIDDAMMESIEPYSMKDAVDFQTAYLAGYFANKYDVDSTASSIRANVRIENSTTASFSKTAQGYSTVTLQSANIKQTCGAIRYALLPVWLLSTKWEGKNFIFAMNGQTGKFAGDLPLDKKAKRRWFWAIFGISLAALLLVSQGILSLIWGGM